MPKLPILGDTSNISENGLAGLDHNFLTGKIEDLIPLQEDLALYGLDVEII